MTFETIRGLLGLDPDWHLKTGGLSPYTFLRGKAAECRVFVFESGILGNDLYRKIDVDEFSAFVLCDPFVPVVFINSLDTPAGKASSLLEALSHIATGESYLIRDELEDEDCSTMVKDSAPEALSYEACWDPNFLQLLRASVHEGTTRYTDAYRITGCWGTDFDRLISEDG